MVDAGRQDIGDNVSHSGAHVPEERESEEGNEPTAKKQRLHLIKASVNNIMEMLSGAEEVVDKNLCNKNMFNKWIHDFNVKLTKRHVQMIGSCKNGKGSC